MYGLQRVRELENFNKKKQLQQEQQQQKELISSSSSSSTISSTITTSSSTSSNTLIGSSIFDFPRTKVESFISQSDPSFIESSFNDNNPSINSNIDTNIASTTLISSNNIVKISQQSFPAYQGRLFTQEEIETVLYDMDPWITVESFENEDVLISTAVEDLANGHIIAWYQGKSEFGQRALGSRSILADPRKKEYRIIINEKIKEREWYRPLAPSVLDEYAGDWFIELENNQNASPYMSLTATVLPDKRELVPAICHVDHTGTTYY